MTVETQAGLIEALARADYEPVIATPEAHWVDFKRGPYTLDTPRGQWELAKDVAAMAEARGGLIVIGYATERHVAEWIEVASEHHPVPKRLVDPQRYRDIVAERVYPHVARHRDPLVPARCRRKGWRLSQHLAEGAPLRINPITLTEYTLEYFRLVDEQIAILFGYSNGSPTWPVRVVGRRMKSELIVLYPGPLRGPGIPLTPPGREHLARSDDWDMEFTATGDPEVDAFAALVHVYALFGLSRKDIPHTENERVSTEAVRAL